MTTYYRTALTAVGPDVADLLDGGILILFAEGAPPELAEVSVLHRVEQGPTAEAPPVGATITIGELSAKLTAIGGYAWAKVAEIGHVVINFDGGTETNRPGEISASRVEAPDLLAAIKPGAVLTISA
ncbi:PTS glucitol/sorbitol transporter subunit IIA [Lichenibacterium dinghuense]|uniref:PTS glucitol/sorbitol transporter subunit IIA n=1 Tax=Lichenibacterium dinghuense TaxID=2895977 RepID=UPI001F36AB85|nr:PTS glucitol/sorbitol transporter subunit IIA [Lichenibacterium sp. 6Y81]